MTKVLIEVTVEEKLLIEDALGMYRVWHEKGVSTYRDMPHLQEVTRVYESKIEALNLLREKLVHGS